MTNPMTNSTNDTLTLLKAEKHRYIDEYRKTFNIDCFRVICVFIGVFNTIEKRFGAFDSFVEAEAFAQMLDETYTKFDLYHEITLF